MTRRRNTAAWKTIGTIVLAVVALPILFANWIHDSLGVPQVVTYILLAGFLVLGLVGYFSERDERVRSLQLADIDAMDGIEFEKYIERLLEKQGYATRRTPGSGDLELT